MYRPKKPFESFLKLCFMARSSQELAAVVDHVSAGRFHTARTSSEDTMGYTITEILYQLFLITVWVAKELPNKIPSWPWRY